MEELTLQVSYLIPVKSCLRGFPAIKYTSVPYLKVVMLCVFALGGLIVLMVHWTIAYSEQSCKMASPGFLSNFDLLLKRNQVIFNIL